MRLRDKLLLVGFLLACIVMIVAAAGPPPPLRYQWLTTNSTTGTFANGDLPVWDDIAKTWVPGNGSGVTKNLDQFSPIAIITIKSGALTTNLFLHGTPTLSANDVLEVSPSAQIIVDGNGLTVSEMFLSGTNNRIRFDEDSTIRDSTASRIWLFNRFNITSNETARLWDVNLASNALFAAFPSPGGQGIIRFDAPFFNVDTLESGFSIGLNTNSHLGIASAGPSQSGTISSTDWNTFNQKTPTNRTITINGTANQITSSAGAQALNANRTWTLSLPNNLSINGVTNAGQYYGDASGLTNIPYGKVFTSTNGIFTATANPDGSTNWTFTLTNLAGLASGSSLTTNANQFLGIPLSIVTDSKQTNNHLYGNVTVQDGSLIGQAAAGLVISIAANGGFGMTMTGDGIRPDSILETLGDTTRSWGEFFVNGITNLTGLTNVGYAKFRGPVAITTGSSSNLVWVDTNSASGEGAWQQVNASMFDASVTNWINSLVGSVNQNYYFDTNNSIIPTGITFTNGPAGAITNSSMILTPNANAGTNSINLNVAGTPYFMCRISTNQIVRLDDGPCDIQTYIWITGSGSVTAHPELWLFNTNGPASNQVAVAADQVFSATIPTLYNSSMNVVASTNLPVGTYLVLRWMMTAKTGSPVWNFAVGGNYDSHLSINVKNASSAYFGSFTGDGSGLTNLNLVAGYGVEIQSTAGVPTFNTTNRATLIASNATTAQADFSTVQDLISTDEMRANLSLYLTNLVQGRTITAHLFGDTNAANFTVTLLTNGLSTSTLIRWDSNSATNGSTAFTVTNNQVVELSIKCVRLSPLPQEIHAVWGPFK